MMLPEWIEHSTSLTNGVNANGSQTTGTGNCIENAN